MESSLNSVVSQNNQYYTQTYDLSAQFSQSEEYIRKSHEFQKTNERLIQENYLTDDESDRSFDTSDQPPTFLPGQDIYEVRRVYKTCIKFHST